MVFGAVQGQVGLYKQHKQPRQDCCCCDGALLSFSPCLSLCLPPLIPWLTSLSSPFSSSFFFNFPSHISFSTSISLCLCPCVCVCVKLSNGKVSFLLSVLVFSLHSFSSPSCVSSFHPCSFPFLFVHLTHYVSHSLWWLPRCLIGACEWRGKHSPHTHAHTPLFTLAFASFQMKIWSSAWNSHIKDNNTSAPMDLYVSAVPLLAHLTTGQSLLIPTVNDSAYDYNYNS